MTQPKFAPIAIEDEVRPAYRLGVPRPWQPHRPGEFDPHDKVRPRAVGPDQGYLALLAERFVGPLVLDGGEQREDALSAVIAIGLGRAAVFGRAPVKKDLDYALSVFGYLTSLPPEQVALRRQLVGGVSHDLWRRNELLERFSDDLLRKTPEQAVSDDVWKQIAGS